MRKILAITWKDISVLLRDRTALLLAVAAPLALTLAMGLVTGGFGDNTAPTIANIPVLIVDHDGGQFATALIDVFTGDDLSAFVTAEQWDDEAAAIAAVGAGDATAAVIIPPGFSDSFLPDATGATPAPVALRVYGDPGRPIGASIVRSIAEEFTRRVQTGVTTVQIAMTDLIMSGAISPEALPEVGRAMGQGLFNRDDPTGGSLIAIHNETAAAGGAADAPVGSLSFFAPGMALFFLMYAVTLGARTFLSERREGTLARMLVAPVSSAQVLSGKVGAIFVSGVLQLGVLVLLTSLLFRLNWGNPLGVGLVIVAAALAATGWALLLASAATSEGQVAGLGMALTLIFGMLGGSIVPTQQMGSPVIDALARLTPNRWAMDGFNKLAYGEGAAAVLPEVAALLVMAAALFVVAAAIFRRRQGNN